MEKYPTLRMSHFAFLRNISWKRSNETHQLCWNQVWTASLCPPQTGSISQYLVWSMLVLECPEAMAHTVSLPFSRVSSTCLGSFLQSLVLSSFQSSSGTAPWTAQLPSATVRARRNLRAARVTPRSPQGRRLARLLRSVRCRSQWEAQHSS